MQKKIFILFLLFIVQFHFAQTETPQVKEIKAIIAKSGEYLTKLECEKSLRLAKSALEKALKIQDYEQTARAYNLIGLNLEQYSDYKKAIFFYQKGLKYADNCSNNFMQYAIHTNLANCYCFKKGIITMKEYNRELLCYEDFMAIRPELLCAFKEFTPRSHFIKNNKAIEEHNHQALDKSEQPNILSYPTKHAPHTIPNIDSFDDVFKNSTVYSLIKEKFEWVNDYVAENIPLIDEDNRMDLSMMLMETIRISAR